MAHKTSIASRRCQLCGAIENLLICSRCRTVFYCSKEHQKKHWKLHKVSCSKEQTDANNTTNTESKTTRTTTTTTKGAVVNALQEVAQMKIAESENETAITSTTTLLNRTTTGSGSGAIANNSPHSSKDEVTFADKLNDESKEGTSNRLNGQNKSNNQQQQQPKSEVSHSNNTANSHELTAKQVNQQHMAFSFQQQKKVKIHSVYAEKFHSNSSQCHRMCEQIVSDLNTHGICVIDKFLGEELGSLILDEVKAMYNSGVFKDGQLVSSKKKDSSTTIRGDKITWVEGVEEGCRHVGDLIGIVDSLIAQCNKFKDNGELGNYDIGGRTKAMVACYPGGGAHYVKHVDNPNHDGRCITSIYYLNKDWNERRGGLLRIFPDGRDQVADIVPIFDRIVFFWSDRRNPHEVQASFQTRYAITLWYFDQRERKNALQHLAQLKRIETDKIKIS